jgi:hypothetical protein
MPLVGIGTPHPLSRERVCPYPRSERGSGGPGGTHSPTGEGVRECQFQRMEKKLSTLPTLWPFCYFLQYSLYRSVTSLQQELLFWMRYSQVVSSSTVQASSSTVFHRTDSQIRGAKDEEIL